MSRPPNDTTPPHRPPVAVVRTAVLDDGARRVVQRAREVVDSLLDDLRRELLACSGTSRVEMKADGSPVTPHDRETGERLTARLLEIFPTHGVIDEEAARVAPATDWTWVLDPIDGTSNFIAGLPYWCISVSLCFEGSPALGVIEAPALGQRYVAVAGGGAVGRTGGQQRTLRVSDPVDLWDRSNGHIPGLYSGGAARDLTADGVALNARIMGASALDLAMVASGTAPLAVTLGPHVWDIAAGSLLVTEAAGACASAAEQPLLPLVPGRDYGAETTPTAAAVDERTARAALVAVAQGRMTRLERA